MSELAFNALKQLSDARNIEFSRPLGVFLATAPHAKPEWATPPLPSGLSARWVPGLTESQALI